MEANEHQEQLEKWIAPAENRAKEFFDLFATDREAELSHALYAFSELGLFSDGIEIKSTKLALRVWAVVEAVRRRGFPDELRI